MNIYCLIFMCTFGANGTDTEIPVNGSVSAESNAVVSKLGNEKDVASLILPGKGEPVPQFGDIVMELPKPLDASTKPFPQISITELSKDSTEDSETPNPSVSAPSLAEILLPPGPLRPGEKTFIK